MLKDDLQACLVSGYSFIGCSKFDQVDGYFGPGATKCHYRGVAEIAFAQGACLFAETFTKGLHKGIVHLHKGGCTKCLHKGLARLHRLPQGACTGLHTGLYQGLAQRLAQAAATWRGDGRHLR